MTSPGDPRLVVVRGPLVGTIVELSGAADLTIGRRSTSALRLPDALISRDHCVVRRRLDGWVVEDLGSRQGTRVNGVRVKSQRLGDGDRIALGECELAFVGGRPRSRATAADVVDDEPLAHASELTLDEALLSHPERLLAPVSSLPSEDGVARQAAELDAMLRIGEAVRAAEGALDLARRVLELTLDLLAAQRAGLMLVEGRAAGAPGEVRLLEAVARDGRRLRISRTIAERVLDSGVALLSNAATSDEISGPSASISEDAVSAVLCVPLALYDRVVGVLYADSAQPSARFEPRHLDLATAMAALVAMPLAYSLREGRAPILGDLATTAPRPAARRGERAALVLLPDAPLDLGGALALRDLPGRLSAGGAETFAIVMDYGTSCSFGGAPTEAILERLAVIAPSGIPACRASAVPAVARLAALVATSHVPAPAVGQDGAKSWLSDVLLHCAVAGAGCSVAAVEPASQLDPAAIGREDALAGGSMGVALRRWGGAAWPAPPRIVGAGIPSMPPLDGSEPSQRSARGVVLVSDSPDVVARKLRAAKTDASPVLDPERFLSPHVAGLLLLLSLLTNESMGSLLARLSGKGYGVLKGELVDAAEAFLAPIRARREELRADSGLVARMSEASASLDAGARDLASALSRSPAA